jgi:aspartyl protease family protein
MNRLLGTAFAAILVMAVFARIASTTSIAPASDAPVQMVAASGASAMVADSEPVGEGVVLRRDGTGQFHIDGRVNGMESKFLVDTGADIVALTVGTAQQAGIPVDTASFQPILQTASGPGNGARYRVDELEVAGHPFRDVDVVVVDGLETNLLGQSLLRRLGKVELQGDRLVIGRE